MTVHRYTKELPNAVVSDKCDFIEYASHLLVTLTFRASSLGLNDLSYFLSMAAMEATEASKSGAYPSGRVEPVMKMSA